ncbi:ribosomal subunit interface protein [Candidatus Falkowbacteria bacterium RIFOXYD2_FULL_35_9]|nr:MAG: ribosomal subunit interface protein [Candidatus Falkowbacteria bacterium RIFOXYD2_FULL_35_9]
MDLTESIKNYANEKLGGIDKYFDNIQQIDVEVGKTTKGQAKGDVFFAEINVSVPGKLLRYRDETDELYKAINATKKGMQNEIKKYKEKMRTS